VKSSREVGRVGIIKELWMRTGLKTGLNHIRRRHKDKFKALHITNLNEQLSFLGLKIHPVTADGNCFYSAVADQLEGNEEAHGKSRHLAVDYIQDHREEFEPFVEDEVSFDEYCKTMWDDGT
jgi:OTU domain-containing protein 3